MAGVSVGKLVNGIWRQTVSVQPYTVPYQTSLLVVASGATTGQINGPITSGTAITLPNSQTYNSTELLLKLNGLSLTVGVDYTNTSTTQITFLYNLVVGDLIEFIITRQY